MSAAPDNDVFMSLAPENPERKKMKPDQEVTLYYIDRTGSKDCFATTMDKLIDDAMEDMAETVLGRKPTNLERGRMVYYRLDMSKWQAEKLDASSFDTSRLERLVVGDKIQEIWPGKPGEDDVHVFVEYRPRRTITGLPERDPESDQRRYIEGVERYGISPSAAARQSNFIVQQEMIPIHIGRPDFNLPVGLFHPIFDRFRSLASATNGEWSGGRLQAAHQLIAASSQLYSSESERRDAIREPLAKLMGYGMMTVSDMNGTVSDMNGTVTNTVMAAFFRTSEGIRCTMPTLFGEFKNDIGEGGCDPTLQGCFSARNFLIHGRRRLRELLQSSCMPHFILAIAGPWMWILGGVFLELYQAEPLIDCLWLGEGPNTADRIKRIATYFEALSTSLRELEEYYQNLVLSGPDTRRFYPHIRATNDEQLEYRSKLVISAPPKPLFEASLGSSKKKVVVKFAKTYNAAAHQLLAEKGFAPKLLFDGSSPASPLSASGFKVIVMEFVEGSMVLNKYESQALPEDIITQLDRALDILHDANFVFGDLRRPNIMVTDKGRVKLVDFDWSGTAGVDRYPVDLNDNLDWPEGVGRNRVMMKKHDRELLEKIKISDI